MGCSFVFVCLSVFRTSRLIPRGRQKFERYHVVFFLGKCFLFNKRYKTCDVDNFNSTLFSIYPTGRQHSPFHRHAKEFQGLGFVDLRKCQLRSNWKTSKGLLVYSVFLYGKVRAIFAQVWLTHHRGQTSKSLFLFFIAGISFTS